MSEPKQIYWQQLNHDELPPRDAIFSGSLNAWLQPITIPPRPEPRDARTDPPKKTDGDRNGIVLTLDNAGIWVRDYWRNVKGFWLPLPPAPPPAKSDAEKAWETHCGPGAQNPWFRDDSHAKAIFTAGYNAAKGAK